MLTGPARSSTTDGTPQASFTGKNLSGLPASIQLATQMAERLGAREVLLPTLSNSQNWPHTLTLSVYYLHIRRLPDGKPFIAQTNAMTPEHDPQKIQAALQVMRETFREMAEMTDEDWQHGLPHFEVLHAKPKTSLQDQGKKVDTNYFVVSGLVRFFYNTVDGKDVNKAFYADRNIIGNLSSIILDEPSRYGIETLEACVLVSIPFTVLNPQLKSSSGWDRLFNRSCQRMLIRNERREAELMMYTPRERFRRFVSNFPSYLERIPQYHIASYLGITPVALSRSKNDWLKDG